MKDRPILFNGEMVRALLEGRKTQTRRVVKLPGLKVGATEHFSWAWTWDLKDGHTKGLLQEEQILEYCPYGLPGDRLWVRETWATVEDYDYLPPRLFGPLMVTGDWTPHMWYAADEDNSGGNINMCAYGCRGRTRRSIHMPRWASRINLEVVAVRVERVQGISEADAKAEGVDPYMADSGAQNPDGSWIEIPQYYATFAQLWDSINAKRGYGWDENPWVWVVEFKRINNESEGG